MTGELWYRESELIQVSGYEIAVKRSFKGDRPILVLLHGFPTCSYDWYKMWSPLADKYNLLAFDFLGFGRSAKPYPHDYSIIEQSNITSNILSYYNITSCYLLAHDYAVSVAQELLSRSEEGTFSCQLLKVIFLNGGLFSETHRARPIQKLLLSPIGKIVNTLSSRRTTRRALDRVFGPNTKLSDEEFEELWALINYNNGKRIFYRLIRYIEDRRKNRDRWVNNMQKTKIPMKLVNGPLDPVSGIHLVTRYKELIPDANTVILKDIGHYPNLEAPDNIVAIAMDFFV